MDFTSVPIILVSCYLFGELFKFVFRKHEEVFKLIPILVTILGGLFGLLIYFTNKELLNVSNVYNAILVGFISGGSSTTTNQIIKKLFSHKDGKSLEGEIDE